MKKIVSVLLCLVMMMSLCTVAFATDCDHMGQHFKFVSNGNGTHNVVCADCGDVVTPNMACTYENGKCITCGAEKPDQKPECKHEGEQKLVPNADGKTHNAYCPNPDCNELMSENIPHSYIYENNTKCACGAEKPVCDHVGVQKVVDNKDGKTHTVICPKCNEVLYTDVAHVYAEDTGKCACGAVKPAECKHEGAQKLVPNKDKKTHNAYCPECGELMSEKIPHTYQYNKKGEFVGKGGAYCLCGAKKSTSSKGGSTTTTTTTTTTKSPKTGDMGVVLYAATALLSLSGTAVVIKKRKNDK